MKRAVINADVRNRISHLRRFLGFLSSRNAPCQIVISGCDLTHSLRFGNRFERCRARAIKATALSSTQLINEYLSLSELTANHSDFSLRDFFKGRPELPYFLNCNCGNGILLAANLQCVASTDCNLLVVEWHDAVLKDLDLRGAIFNSSI